MCIDKSTLVTFYLRSNVCNHQPNLNKVYLICGARTSMCITLPIVLQSFSLLLKKMDLGENLLQNPKSQRMEIMERKRERE